MQAETLANGNAEHSQLTPGAGKSRVGGNRTQNSRLSHEHRELLHARNLTDKTIELAGLWSGSPEDVRHVLGFNPNNTSGLIIPFFDPQTSKIRYHRVRCDTPPVIGGKPARYLSQKGAGNFLYFPPELNYAAQLRDTDGILYWTESEFKTLVGWQDGLLIVGSIGVWGWKGKGLDGHSKPIADLDLITWLDRTLAIVFDSDVVLNVEVQRARQALGKEAYRRGVEAAYGINLPGGANGDKVGWDDYRASHSLSDFFDLPPILLPPTDLPLFTEPISHLLSGPEELIEWGIVGILPLGASGWRIAGPKVGKSWDMLEEEYCLATAQSVFGHFSVPRKRKVLMIEEEDPKRRIQRRLKRIIHAHGGIQPSDEFFRYSVKKGVRLDDAKWQEVLEWEIRSFRPDFVYLDVFNRLHSKDINDAEAMGKIVLFLDELNRKYECAFILLHHTRKNSAVGMIMMRFLAHERLEGSRKPPCFCQEPKKKAFCASKQPSKTSLKMGLSNQSFSFSW